MPDLKHRESIRTPQRTKDRLLLMESISSQELRTARRQRPVRALRRAVVIALQLLPLVGLVGLLAYFALTD